MVGIFVFGLLFLISVRLPENVGEIANRGGDSVVRGATRVQRNDVSPIFLFQAA
ncbi:hypothetical protein [Alysiella crassa]|uniref:hypothetical protein n=1 Tax=Alysiella crassa TaxID=153491 RepID=UPI001FD5B226|nr:hypothetical protein [Alysiella crassa]UOP07595.1 hypothetical protein LVJ80_04240 [Alysiella crassa]